MSYAAMTKEMDLRKEYACWLSKEIDSSKYPGLEFDRILCLEPLLKDLSIPEMIADLFKALEAISVNFDISSICFPLISTGDSKLSVNVILNNFVEASANWIALGLPTDVIKIVAFDDERTRQASFNGCSH